MSIRRRCLMVRLRAADGSKRQMETKIMRVVKCGEQFTVKSEKSENGQMAKRNLVLQEVGGKYENQ